MEIYPGVHIVSSFQLEATERSWGDLDWRHEVGASYLFHGKNPGKGVARCYVDAMILRISAERATMLSRGEELRPNTETPRWSCGGVEVLEPSTAQGRVFRESGSQESEVQNSTTHLSVIKIRSKTVKSDENNCRGDYTI